METVKNYQVPLIESNMDLLKKMTGETVAKAALEKSVEWTLNRIPRMQAALQAAKDFLEAQSKEMSEIGEWEQESCNEIIKQIDKALEEEK